MTLHRQTLHSQGAISYLRDALSQGRSLSRLLLETDLDRGTVWTYLRTDVPLDYASDHLNETWLVVAEEEVDPAIVRDGYHIRRKPTSLEPLYLDFIAQFLAGSPNACCIFEDALSKPGDSFLETRKSGPYTSYADDIFYVVEHETATRECIETNLRETRAWAQTCLLAELPDGFGAVAVQRELSTRQLSMLVDGVRAILVLAFDGVGYVVWQPP